MQCTEELQDSKGANEARQFTSVRISFADWSWDNVDSSYFISFQWASKHKGGGAHHAFEGGISDNLAGAISNRLRHIGSIVICREVIDGPLFVDGMH